MDIEKLCEEFHEKVGKDKTVRISVEEGDTKNEDGWVYGKIDENVWNEIKANSTKDNTENLPFLLESMGDGVRHSYISFKA